MSAATGQTFMTAPKHRIESMIKGLEDRITRAIASDDRLPETAGRLRSIPGIGRVASTMLPLMHENMHCRAVDRQKREIGTITGEQAAARTG